MSQVNGPSSYWYFQEVLVQLKTMLSTVVDKSGGCDNTRRINFEVLIDIKLFGQTRRGSEASHLVGLSTTSSHLRSRYWKQLTCIWLILLECSLSSIVLGLSQYLSLSEVKQEFRNWAERGFDKFILDTRSEERDIDRRPWWNRYRTTSYQR